jgi:nicotinamide riboside transporter PnuC
MTWLWLVSAASLLGVVLNIHHRAECFAIWIATNVIWAAVDWSQGIHAQAALHALYVLLAVHGLHKWTRKAVEHAAPHPG